jgi:hypothetical protein
MASRDNEHLGQTGSLVAGNQPAEDLQYEMLGSLLLGFGGAIAPSGAGADSSMGSYL